MNKKWLFNSVALFALAVLGLLVFRNILCSPDILMATDDNIGELAQRHNAMPDAFMYSWSSSPLLGTGNLSVPINWSNLLYWFLSPVVAMNGIHLLSLMVGSVLLFSFLRRFQIHPAAAALTSIGAYWVGSNLTLIYAGHTPKFAIMMFVPAALLVTTWLTHRRILIPTLIFGFCLAIMLSEQQDVGLFTVIPVTVYYIFRLIYLKAPWKRVVPAWVLTGMVALLIVSGSLLSGYMGSVKGVSTLEQPFQERWDFSTQWSWPPEETIDFVAPGYMGWRSGEPDGPYWGRMGRSAGWETHHQGFMNFKLENTYLGFIPVVFALFAVYAAFRKMTGPRTALPDEFAFNPRVEILFWSGAALITLLLAFGKYFPLYRVFYELPMVSSIRNPNKFLQIFQICFAILSGWGLHLVLTNMTKDTFKKMVWPFLYALYALCGVFTLWFLLRLFGGDAGRLAAQGWGQAGKVIAQNKTVAILHALVILSLVTGVFLAIYKEWVRSTILCSLMLSGLVLVAGLDAVLLSRHYVTTMPGSWIESNVVTDTLKKNLKHNRVATLSQDGFYNIWLTYLFPYQDIPAFNFTQMPRMPEEYRLFLDALQRNPLRMWQLSGVGAVLAPAQVYDQIRATPELATSLKPVLWYNVQPYLNNNLIVSQTQPSQGSQVVLKFDQAVSGRYRLVAGTRNFKTGTEALQWLASPAYLMFDQVAVTGDDAPSLSGHGLAGSVLVKSYSPATVELEVNARCPCILRAADRYDPNWKARIDGKDVSSVRIDFCMNGYLIPAGKHVVTLMYRPSLIPFYAQLIGLGLFFLILAGAAIRRKPRVGK
ncbi:MAG: hypothetical protein EOL87_16815 [Spartobacteria bacterium]|nr:hypothetical protein [Spartobacteria bacterium]